MPKISSFFGGGSSVQSFDATVQHYHSDETVHGTFNASQLGLHSYQRIGVTVSSGTMEKLAETGWQKVPFLQVPVISVQILLTPAEKVGLECTWRMQNIRGAAAPVSSSARKSFRGATVRSMPLLQQRHCRAAA